MLVLDRTDPRRNYAGPVLNKLLADTDEKQRATDLVYGTIRNRLAIDMVIAKLAQCPIERIARKVVNIVRAGAYELIYCPETSDYAIVNEAVNLAHSVAGKKDANFVNAVLRKTTRVIFQRNASLKRVSLTRCIPTDHTSGCEFIDDLLPDPEFDANSYLSKAFSIPKWLVREWLRLDSGAMLPPDKDLREELLIVDYTFHKLSGKIQVMAQDVIKEHIGRSPNRADALRHTFYEPELLYPDLA